MQTLKLALAEKPDLTPPLSIRALETQRLYSSEALLAPHSWRANQFPGVLGTAEKVEHGALAPGPDPDQRSWGNGSLEKVCLRPSLSAAFFS